MKKYRFSLVLILTALIVFSPSCEKSQVGYVEVRNKSLHVIEDVSWGRIINLGTLKPNEENGKETEIFGEEYIHLSIEKKRFRSKNKIVVDAQTSATFIVKDTTDLVHETD